MDAWSDLDRELEAWQTAGQAPTFWWRDDDAVAPTPALERLIGIAERHDVPLMLAVIPQPATEALRRRIEAAPLITVAQHGLGHRNNASAGDRASEFPPSRTLSQNVTDMTEGLTLLHGFPHLVPVFVPPWNRIDARLFPGIASVGHRGVSTFGPRALAQPLPGFTQANCHADIIAWKTTRGFIGVGRVLDDVIDHLRARRAGRVDALEPTGLLTHHLVHDADCWRFLDLFWARLSQPRLARWRDSRSIFGLPATADVGG